MILRCRSERGGRLRVWQLSPHARRAPPTMNDPYPTWHPPDMTGSAVDEVHRTGPSATLLQVSLPSSPIAWLGEVRRRKNRLSSSRVGAGCPPRCRRPPRRGARKEIRAHTLKAVVPQLGVMSEAGENHAPGICATLPHSQHA